MEGDLDEAEKLRTEKRKALLDSKADRHQNRADYAQSKIDRNNVLAENETTAAGKSKYLKKNESLIRNEYDHLIKIAKLRNDNVEATRLEAEAQKELNDNLKQQFQNLADENSAKMDYWKLKQDNAIDASTKNKFEQSYRDEMRNYYGNLRKAAFDNPQEQLRLDEEFQQKMAESYNSFDD